MVKDFCGPYYTYTAKGALTVTPYTEAEQPLDSIWAAQTIERWRRRMKDRRERSA